jgi:hypothetical protein
MASTTTVAPVDAGRVAAVVTADLPTKLDGGTADDLLRLGLIDRGRPPVGSKLDKQDARRFELPPGYTVRPVTYDKHEIVDRRGLPIIAYWHDVHPWDRRQSWTQIINVGACTANRLCHIHVPGLADTIPIDLLTPTEVGQLAEELERLADDEWTAQHYPRSAAKAQTWLSHLRGLTARKRDGLNWGEILTDLRLIGSVLEGQIAAHRFRGIIIGATVEPDIVIIDLSRDDDHTSPVTFLRADRFTPEGDDQLTCRLGEDDFVTLTWAEAVMI